MDMKVFLVSATNFDMDEYDAVVYIAISEDRALVLAYDSEMFSTRQYPLKCKEIVLNKEQKVLASFNAG